MADRLEVREKETVLIDLEKYVQLRMKEKELEAEIIKLKSKLFWLKGDYFKEAKDKTYCRDAKKDEIFGIDWEAIEKEGEE